MHKSASIVVGGIGGSGTRAVAKLFQELGYFMGSDLNTPLDNLLYTLFFKRKEIVLLDKKSFAQHLRLYNKIMSSDERVSDEEFDYMEKLADNDNTQHDTKFLKQRIEHIRTNPRKYQQNWGWKEPNTHIFIDRLLDESPSLRFIYVYRDGLDMAYSSNQNQLKFWGNIFLNEDIVDINPKNSLRYWCLVHKRMLKLSTNYKDRIYMLDNDKLCNNPKQELNKLLKFLALEGRDVEKLAQVFKKPDSVGRYKQHPLSNFNKEDFEFCRQISLGLT